MKFIYKLTIGAAISTITSAIVFIAFLYYCLSEYLKVEGPPIIYFFLYGSFLFTILSALVTIGFFISSIIEFLSSRQRKNAEQGAAANP